MNGIDVNEISAVQRLSLIQQGEAALKRRKNDPAIHYQLALLHRANGSAENSIEHLKSVLKADKKNKDALVQLADIYTANKAYIKAKKYVRRLVEFFPRDELVLIYQAEFLAKANQLPQAAAAWEKIIKLFPDNPDNFHSLAACKRQLGDWESAKALHHKVLDLDPLHSSSLYMLANSAKHEPEEAQKLISALEKAIEAGDPEKNPIDHANLYYACGKLYAELGDYQRAMEYYGQANDQRNGKQWSELQQPFNNMTAAFSRTVISEKAKLGEQDASPVFIVGMPRSGTTLTESLLGAHSKVLAGDELPFMGQIGNRLGHEGAKTDAFVNLIQSLDKNTIQSLINDYVEGTRHLRKDHPHFTDKLPHNFLRVGLTKVLFPNAKIIHCRRHPVDNCLSLYTNSMMPYHNAYKTDLKTLGLYYRRYEKLMEHWRREVPGGFYEVHYEDLVANTELNARAMIEYLGLEWEDNVLKRENSQKSVRTLSVWQVRQPVYTSSAGRWKKFEAHLGPLIDALGGSVKEYEEELQALSKETSA